MPQTADRYGYDLIDPTTVEIEYATNSGRCVKDGTALEEGETIEFGHYIMKSKDGSVWYARPMLYADGERDIVAMLKARGTIDHECCLMGDVA